MKQAIFPPTGRSALTAVMLSLLFSGPSYAAESVAEFRGSMSRNTPDFEVQSPWLLDWRISTEGQHDSAVEVSLHSAGTGVHQGRVLMTKYPGNGVRLFKQSGEFYFRVDSSFSNWTLKVKQLTPQEAEQYTPVKRSALDR